METVCPCLMQVAILNNLSVSLIAKHQLISEIGDIFGHY